MSFFWYNGHSKMEKKWTISGLIALCLIAVVGIVITLMLLIGSSEKKLPNPLEGLKSGGLVAISDENKAEERRSSLSPWDSVKTMGKAAEAVKKRFERIRAEKTILADKEKLLSLLAPVSGWQIKKSQYYLGGYGEEETANLNITYSGADSRSIEVEIIDYGATPAALQPMKMIFKMERDEEMEQRDGKVSDYNGHLVFEEYNRRKKQRQFSSILKDRYLIKLKHIGNNSRKTLQNFTQELFSQK